jgi:hypothetical protein
VIYTGTTQQFDATVTGNLNTLVTWSTDGGSVNVNGLYTAPGTPGTYHVTATSVADPSASDTVEVVVLQLVQSGMAVSPPFATIEVNSLQQFTAVFLNLAPGATWVVEEAGGGEIDADGLYTAPNVPGVYHVTATSTADPTVSATAEITVIPEVGVSVSPGAISMTTGTQQQFVATVTGTANTAVTWSASGGTINSNGLYTAPGTPGTYYVTATSVADPSKSDTVEVVVTSPPLVTGITITPSSVILEFGQTQQFSAILVNLNPGVTWSVDEGSAGGTITSTGLYTAPGTVGTFHVTVTSTDDPTKSSTATVTVVPPIVVFLTPKAVHLDPGESFQFRAHAQGSTMPDAIDWYVVEPNGGTITDTGLYTAPATPGVYHVVAASVQNPSRKYTATIRVDSPL